MAQSLDMFQFFVFLQVSERSLEDDFVNGKGLDLTLLKSLSSLRRPTQPQEAVADSSTGEFHLT